MNKKIKKKWLKALRNGEVNGKPVVQVTGNLRMAGKTVLTDGVHKGKKAARMCCLGVLCEIAVAEGVIPAPIKDKYGTFVYGPGPDGEDAELPADVVAWAGLDASDPTVYGVNLGDNDVISEVTLAALNDDHEFTFKKIAKVIDKNL